MLLIKSLPFESYDTLRSSSSRSSILVIAGVAVVLCLSNFKASADTSHRQTEECANKKCTFPVFNCRNPIDVKFHLRQGYGVMNCLTGNLSIPENLLSVTFQACQNVLGNNSSHLTTKWSRDYWQEQSAILNLCLFEVFFAFTPFCLHQLLSFVFAGVQRVTSNLPLKISLFKHLF